MDDDWQDGGAPTSPSTSHRRNLYCEACGGRDFQGDDDGFYYCTQCGSQSQDLMNTAVAAEDLLANGGLYNIRYTRALSQSQTNPNPKSKHQIDLELSQALGVRDKAKEESTVKFIGFDDDEMSEPRDFGSGSLCSDGDKLADGIRLRYVEGLQVMLQRQCEVLVEKFGASPYIIGIVGPIWLRYMATTRVLADDWPEKVMEESEEAAEAAGLIRLGEEDYSKDLFSYLKHCKDVVYAGITKSYDEEKLIERLWDLYEKQEDDLAKEETKPRNGPSVNDSLDAQKGKEAKQGRATAEDNITTENHPSEPPVSPNCPTAAANATIQRIKIEMEENGFEYLPPRAHQKIGYVQYKRQRIDGRLVYVAHADYYILLRACAKLAEVDAQTMHRCVLSLERRLDWIDRQIDKLFSHQDGTI